MNRPLLSPVSRRSFLSCAAAACVAGRYARADEPPPVKEPRATSGDTVVEPAWNERVTIRVGPKEGDLIGSTDRVLQAAVNYVSRLGGGSVQILPGTYRLRNSVYLASKVRLVGSGPESVLVKEPMAKAKLAVDSDWFDQEITLAEGADFRVGDGICLQTKDKETGRRIILKRTLVARSGPRFKLDRPLRENLWLMGESTAATLFPILSGEFVADVAVENLALDGNGQNNDLLDGNYAGCIFMQDCSRAAIRGVTARNYHGDGISWQICHDVRVEDCHVHDNTGLGLHPGSGSQRPIIRGNKLEDNDIGIFFCWGVKYGLAEANTIRGARSYGVSIGHRDNENLIVANDISASGKAGVLFRPERGKAFAPHRNRLERNRITDSGPANGIGIDVQGQTESITISGNEIRETRGPEKRVGIRIGADTRDVQLVENKFDGLATPIQR